MNKVVRMGKKMVIGVGLSSKSVVALVAACASATYLTSLNLSSPICPVKDERLCLIDYRPED